MSHAERPQVFRMARGNAKLNNPTSRSVRLVTPESTGQERLYLFNYNAVERGGSIESMITLREGDVVLVPERHLFE